MSFTHTISRSYRDSSGTPITSTEVITSNNEGNYDDSIADSSSNFEVDLSLTLSVLKSLSISSDKVISIKTNGIGTAGAITSTSISAAGSGYALNDTGTISGGTAGTYIVTGVNGSGGVTAYTVTAGGSAYSPFSVTGTFAATAT